MQQDAALQNPVFLVGLKLPADARLALKAWNIMKGIDWQALPFIISLLGIEDIELFISQLLAIREHQENSKEVSDNG